MPKKASKAKTSARRYDLVMKNLQIIAESVHDNVPRPLVWCMETSEGTFMQKPVFFLLKNVFGFKVEITEGNQVDFFTLYFMWKTVWYGKLFKV